MSLAKSLAVLFAINSVANSLKFPTEDSPDLNCTDVQLSTSISQIEPLKTALTTNYTKSKKHKKRNAINLYYMIGECTKCSAWELLGYGKYCGFGGSGTPVDDIDRCCQSHDHCYGAVMKTHDCWRFNVYVLPYDWTVYHGTPYCDQETNQCRREICHCDKKLTECLNRVGCP